jgi:hypothetical protein
MESPEQRFIDPVHRFVTIDLSELQQTVRVARWSASTAELEVDAVAERSVSESVLEEERTLCGAELLDCERELLGAFER